MVVLVLVTVLVVVIHEGDEHVDEEHETQGLQDGDEELQEGDARTRRGRR
jgi:hypothetical protein